ncbi:putative transmembrane protein [Toxoplasma gondii MAS]|uniref:Putative transmembrane protein n=1 Tax=Toxoplasma gondii MAS TaxID=943118 RepID=A0A086QWC0_TOXGO|nr:putative transmembrane protein [Toxoplasma gondii MAS]
MRFAGEDSAHSNPSRLSSAEVSLSQLQHPSSRCLLLGARPGARTVDVTPRRTEAKRTCLKRRELESEETETEEIANRERGEREEIANGERGEIEKKEREEKEETEREEIASRERGEIESEEREGTESDGNGAREREQSHETERDTREETDNEKSEGSETGETDLLSSQDEASADARLSEADRKRVEGHKLDREPDATEKRPDDDPRVVYQEPPCGERASPQGTERPSKEALTKHRETDDDKLSPEEGNGVQEKETATSQAQKERKGHSAGKGATDSKAGDSRAVEGKQAEKAKKPQNGGDERASVECGSPNVDKRQWQASEAGEREAERRREIEKVAESGRSAVRRPDAEPPRAAASAVTRWGEKIKSTETDREETSIQEEDGETPKSQEQAPKVGRREDVVTQVESGSKSAESREAECGEGERDRTLQEAERELGDNRTAPQRSRGEPSPENAAEETAGGAEQDSTGDRQCGNRELDCPKNTSETGNGDNTGGTADTHRKPGETGSKARGNLLSSCDRHKILPLDGEAEESQHQTDIPRETVDSANAKPVFVNSFSCSPVPLRSSSSSALNRQRQSFQMNASSPEQECKVTSPSSPSASSPSASSPSASFPSASFPSASLSTPRLRASLSFCVPSSTRPSSCPASQRLSSPPCSLSSLCVRRPPTGASLGASSIPASLTPFAACLLGAAQPPAEAQQLAPVCAPMQNRDVARPPSPPCSRILSQSPPAGASSGDAASSSAPEGLLGDKQETLNRGRKPQLPRGEMLDVGERGEERRRVSLAAGQESGACDPRVEALSGGQRKDSEQEKDAQVAEAPQHENDEPRSRGTAVDAAKGEETVQEEQRGLACVGRQAIDPRSSSPDEAQRKQEEEPNNQTATEEKHEAKKNSEASAVLQEAEDVRSAGSGKRKAGREEDRETEGDERGGEAEISDVCEAPRDREGQISGVDQETPFACSSVDACLDTETADATAARDGETRDKAEELEKAMELADWIDKSQREEGHGEEGREIVMPAPAASNLLCVRSPRDWAVEPRPTGRSIASFSSPCDATSVSSLQSVAASLAPSLPSSSAFASSSSSSPAVASAFAVSFEPRRDACLSLCSSGTVGGAEVRGRPDIRAQGRTGDPQADEAKEAEEAALAREERRTGASGEGQSPETVEVADAGRARSPGKRVCDARRDGAEDSGPRGEEVDSGDRVDEAVAEAEKAIKPDTELLCRSDSEHEESPVSEWEESWIPFQQAWRSSTKSSRPKPSKSFSSPRRPSRRLGPRLRRPSFARVPRALRSERRGRGEGSSRRGEGSSRRGEVPVSRAGSRVQRDDRDEGKLTGDEQRIEDSPVKTHEEGRDTERGRHRDLTQAEEACRADAETESRGCEQELGAATRHLAENESMDRRADDEGSDRETDRETDGDKREAQAEAETGRKRRDAGRESDEISEVPRGLDRQRDKEASKSGETPGRVADSKREEVLKAIQHTECTSGLGEDRGKEGSARNSHPDEQLSRHREQKQAASGTRHPGRESRRETRETRGKNKCEDHPVAADETATQTAQWVAVPRDVVAPVKAAEELEWNPRENGKRRAGKDETSTREQEWHRDRSSQRREAWETKESRHPSCASSRSLSAVGDSSEEDVRLPEEAFEQGEKHPHHEKQKHVKQDVEELRERVRHPAAVTSDAAAPLTKAETKTREQKETKMREEKKSDEEAQTLGKETGTGAERYETPHSASSGTSASLTSSDQRARPEPQVPVSRFSLASFLSFASWLARPKQSEGVRSPTLATLDEQPSAEQSEAREKRGEQSGNEDSEAIEAFLSASLHAETKSGVVQRRHSRRAAESRDSVVPLDRGRQARSYSEKRPPNALQGRGDNMQSLTKKAARRASRENQQEERGRNEIVATPFIDLPPLFSPPSFSLASLSSDSLAHPSSRGRRSHAVPRSPSLLVREAPSSSPPPPSRRSVLDKAVVSSSSASSGSSANSVSQASSFAASSVSALTAAEPPAASGLSDLLQLWIEEGEKLRREEAESLDQSAFEHSPTRAQTEADFLEACSRGGPHQTLRPISLAPVAADRRQRSVAFWPPASSFCLQSSWTLPPSSSSLRPVESDALNAFRQQMEDPRLLPSAPLPLSTPHVCGAVSISSFSPSHANTLDVSSPFPFLAASAPVAESKPRVVCFGKPSTASPHMDSELRGSAAPRLSRFPPDRLDRDLATREEERRRIVQRRRPDRTGTSESLCAPPSVYRGPENAPRSPPPPSQNVSPDVLHVVHASCLSPLLPTCSEAFFPLPLPFSPSPAPASPLLLPRLSESLQAPGLANSVVYPLDECPSVQVSPPSPFAWAAVETPLLGAPWVSNASLDAQRNAEGNAPRVDGPCDAAFPPDALEVEAAFLSGFASGGEAKNLGSAMYVKSWKGKPRVHNAEARHADEERLGGEKRAPIILRRPPSVGEEERGDSGDRGASTCLPHTVKQREETRLGYRGFAADPFVLGEAEAQERGQGRERKEEMREKEQSRRRTGLGFTMSRSSAEAAQPRQQHLSAASSSRRPSSQEPQPRVGGDAPSAESRNSGHLGGEASGAVGDSQGGHLCFSRRDGGAKGTAGRPLRASKPSSERGKRRTKRRQTSAVQTEETGDDEPSDVALIFGSVVNSSRASSFADAAAHPCVSPVPQEGTGDSERAAQEQRKAEAGTEEGKGWKTDASMQAHDGSSLRGDPSEGKGGRDEKVKRIQRSSDVPSSPTPLFSRAPASESLSCLSRRSQVSLPASSLASSFHPTASLHTSGRTEGKGSAPSPVMPAGESSGRALPSSLASSLSFPLSSLSSALSSPLPSSFSSSVSSSASGPPRVSVGVNAVSHRDVPLRRRTEEKKMNSVSRQWVLASSPQEQSWRGEATKGEGERRRGEKERESETGGRRGSMKSPTSPSEGASFSSPSLFSGSASVFPSSASLGEKRGTEKRKTHRARREKGEVREEGISVFGPTPEEIIQRQQKELQAKREKQGKRERKQSPQTAAAGASASGGCVEALQPHGGMRPEGIHASSTSSLSASHHSPPGRFFSAYSRLALEKEDEEYLFSLPILDDAMGPSSRVVRQKAETAGSRWRRFEMALDGQKEACRSSSRRTGATAEALHAASASEEALKRRLGVLRAQGEEQRLRLDRLERQKSLLEKFEEERMERQAVLASLQEERRRDEEDARTAERQAREQRAEEKEKHSKEPTRGRPAKDRRPSRTRRLSASAIEVVAWLATETEEKVRSVSRRAASRVRKLRRGRDSDRSASASRPANRSPNAQHGNRGRISFQDPHLPEVHPTSDSTLPARLPPHGILLSSPRPGSEFDWTRRTSTGERGQAHASRVNEVTYSYAEQRAVTASIANSKDAKVIREEELTDTASFEVYVHRSEAIESQHGCETTERGRAERSASAGRRGSGRVLRAGESGQNEDGEAASKQRRKRELLRQAATVASLTVATATVTVASAGASAVQSMRGKLRKRRERTEKEDSTRCS